MHSESTIKTWSCNRNGGKILVSDMHKLLFKFVSYLAVFVWHKVWNGNGHFVFTSESVEPPESDHTT